MPQCYGCMPCIVGLKGKDDTVVAVVSCGGPPGNGIGAKLNAIDLWVRKYNPKLLPLVPVYGKCIASCGQCKPVTDRLIAAATGRDAPEEFAHPYSPERLLE
jgi:hypothetical protein